MASMMVAILALAGLLAVPGGLAWAAHDGDYDPRGLGLVSDGFRLVHGEDGTPVLVVEIHAANWNQHDIELDASNFVLLDRDLEAYPARDRDQLREYFPSTEGDCGVPYGMLGMYETRSVQACFIVPGSIQPDALEIRPPRGSHFDEPAVLPLVPFSLRFEAADGPGPTGIGDPKPDPVMDDPVSVFVPSKMIVGEHYIGMITHADHAGRDVRAEITSSGGIDVQEEVIIRDGTDHGLFSITPERGGFHQVTVGIGQDSFTRRVQASAPGSESSLALFIPEKTRIAGLIGAVYLLDPAGNPVITDRPVRVGLRATDGIEVPSSVMIHNGSTGATFKLAAPVSGSVFASSGELEASADISNEPPMPEIKVAVTPNIVLEDSFAYYVIWMELNGEPYTPEEPVDIMLRSSGGGLDIFEGEFFPESEFQLSTWIDTGMIYTGDAGSYTLTVSAGGMGSDTSGFIVGPARFTSPDPGRDILEGGLVPADGDFAAGAACDLGPNLMAAEIIPQVTTGSTNLVAALYKVVGEGSIDDELGSWMHVVPCPVDAGSDGVGRPLTITSDGAEHVAETAFGADPEVVTHAGFFQVAGETGTYEVAVSTPGIPPVGGLGFEARAEGIESYSLELLPLPAIAGHVQDIAFVYITDPAGAVVNPVEELGVPLEITVDSSNAFVKEKTIELDPPIQIVRGAFASSPLGSSISALSEQVSGAIADLDTTRITGGGRAVIEVPDRIRSHEPFPVSAYLVSGGTAVQNLDNFVSTGGACEALFDGRFECGGPGRLVISRDGSDAVADIRPYKSGLGVSLSPDYGKSISVGLNHTITVTASAGPLEIFMEGDIPSRVEGDIIRLHPDKPGTFEQTVIIGSPGFEQFSEVLTIVADERVEAVVEARGPDNILLGVEVEIEGDDEYFAGTAPFTHQFQRQPVTARFPQGFELGERSFDLVRTSAVGGMQEISGGPSLDYTPTSRDMLTAEYREVVQIDVINAQGGGMYGIGDTVRLYAPEREILYFLVRDVIAGWTGFYNPSAELVFTAQTDLVVEAIYRTDYTYLLLILVGAGGGAAFMILRRNTTYMLKAGQLKDHMGGIKFKTGRKKVAKGDD